MFDELDIYCLAEKEDDRNYVIVIIDESELDVEDCSTEILRKRKYKEDLDDIDVLFEVEFLDFDDDDVKIVEDFEFRISKVENNNINIRKVVYDSLGFSISLLDFLRINISL